MFYKFSLFSYKMIENLNNLLFKNKQIHIKLTENQIKKIVYLINQKTNNLK